MDVHPTKNGINRYWSIPKSTQDPDGSPSLGKTAPQLVSLLGTEEAMDYGWHQLFSESEVTWSNAAAIWVIGEDGDFDRNVKGYIYILGFQFQSISVGIVNKDMGICIYIWKICIQLKSVWYLGVSEHGIPISYSSIFWIGKSWLTNGFRVAYFSQTRFINLA